MAELNQQGAQEPDLSMIPYYPYHGGQGNQDWDSQTIVYIKRGSINPQRRQAFITRIEDWLRECIEAIKNAHPGENIILGFVPGHLQNDHNAGFLTELNINDLLDDHFSIDVDMLLRTTTTASQAAGGGVRSIQKHLDTIEVAGDVAGKIVYIMDDVWTTGCTMNACSQLVTEAGANQVYTIVVARTV